MNALSINLSFSTLLLAILIQTTSVNASQPHPHQGKVAPFQPGDPKVTLDGKAKRILKDWKPYQTQIESASGGRGLVVQDIRAPPDVVWGRILDFNKYSNMVPKTAESQIYKTENHPGGRQTIWVRLKVGFPMLKLQFFIKHHYHPNLSSMTWTLDYTQKSDLDDSCGYWFVAPHPQNPTQWTRLYYSVEISMFDWVPAFVVNFMSKKALTDATAWVKKFSEEHAANAGPIVATETTTPQTGFFGWRQRRQRQDKGPVDTKQNTEPDEELSCVSDETQAEPCVVGVKRYALVTTVSLLVLYNVHLFLSH